MICQASFGIPDIAEGGGRFGESSGVQADGLSEEGWHWEKVWQGTSTFSRKVISELTFTEVRLIRKERGQRPTCLLGDVEDP